MYQSDGLNILLYIYLANAGCLQWIGHYPSAEDTWKPTVVNPSG